MFDRKDEELDDEIQSHLGMAARDRVQSGENPRDAQDAAKREFGNVGLVKEVTRQMRSGASLETLLQDLRYGLRMLTKSPGFAVIAVLTLALGIGANTAIFSVVDAVLLNPLPYHDANRLVVLFQTYKEFPHGSVSYSNFLDWQRMNGSFGGMAAYRNSGFSLYGQGEPEPLHGEYISAGFFELLGVTPLLGRTFSADEDQLGANPVVLISERLWRRKFGADPKIIGQRVILNDVGRTIIGVIPDSFHLKIQNFQNWMLNDIYTPIGEFPAKRFRDRASAWGTDAIGRLKPSVTFEQAREDLARVSRQLGGMYPEADANLSITIVPLREEMVGQVRPVLLLLLGAVGFVLLIACVNVANLLLARSTSRQREFAVRVALGASQARLLRQLLTESVLLSLAGGILGLLLAKWGTHAALAFVPQSLPRSEEIALGAPVLLLTFCVSVVAGVLFGMAPAWKTSKGNPGAALKESGRAGAGSRSNTQGALVIAETAMALVLLIGAGLMIRTLVYLWASDPGFNPHNVVTLSTVGRESMKQQSPAAIRTYYRQMREVIASTPGVDSMSFQGGAQPMENDNENYFWIVGTPKPAHVSDMPLFLFYSVEPDYLKVMQIPLKRGRFFDDSDSEQSAPVAVIDESLAEKYFAGRDPLGQYLDHASDNTGPDRPPPAQIVGVVGHVNQWGLDQDGPEALHPEVYTAYWQHADKEVVEVARYNTMYIRTRLSGTPTIDMLRRRLREFDSGLIVSDTSTMDAVVAKTIAAKRLIMALLGTFAIIALLLASVGIYGVLSCLVGQRTREIGVRMALGAHRFDVLRLVLGNGMRMAAIGIAIGVIAALGLTRLMSTVLFGVKPTDPFTFAAVAFLLCCVALLACYVPARRAMRVDPIVALRYE